MRTLPLVAAALLATTFVPLAAASSPSTGAVCYNYLFVADYQWHWVCVDPKGGTCAVYTSRSNSPYSPGEPDCPVDAPATPAPNRCTMLFTDLDYSTWLCVDRSDASCVVSVERRSGGTVVSRACYGVPPLSSAGFETTCIPTSGGLDYHSFLCVDPSNPKCAVYTLTSSDWGVQKKCYGVL